MRAAVRVTIHRKNVHDLEGVAKLLLEDIGLSSFSTNSAGAMGLCRNNAEMIQLTTEDRMLAMQTLLRLAKRYNGRVNAMAGPLAEARVWHGMEEARREGRPSMPNRGSLTGCGCYKSGLSVRADGVITLKVVQDALNLLEIDEISKARIYNYRTVVEKEIAGYKVMSGLLEEFVPAVMEGSTHYYEKLKKLIPSQFTPENDTPYSKIQSVLDFVSGMTDLYAVELFRKIKGISFPIV